MHLNMFVSQRCFIYCKGCYSHSREEKCGEMLDTDKILNFLRYANKKGIKKITICGGDPLTRPDIIDLLKEIKKIGYYISLDTLGTSILKKIKVNSKITITQTSAKTLARTVDMIGIPIDGSTNKIFSLFRPTKDEIVNQQMKICNELHKYGADICINTVLHKGNIEDIFEIAKIIKSLDYVKKWQIFEFEPFGKIGKLNKDLFEISESKFLEIKDKLEKEYNDERIQFKNTKIRNKLYILIDNSGDAYVSSTCNLKRNNRRIIGNIKKEKDWPKIVKYLKMK